MDVDLGPAIHFVHGGMVGTDKEHIRKFLLSA